MEESESVGTAMGHAHWIDQIEAILKKPSEGRNHAESVYLTKTLMQIKYFQELAKVSNPQIIKHVVKHTRVVRPQKRGLVCRKGEPIESYFVVLRGRLAVEKDTCEEHINDKHKLNDMIQMLVRVLAETENKSPKRRGKKVDRDDTLDYLQQLKLFDQYPIPISQMHILEQIGEELSIGDEAREIHSPRRFTAIALQDSVLLEVHFSEILKAIRVYNEKKLQMQLDFFRKFRCFDLFEDEELKVLVQHCRTEERSKNDCVFREGDPASQFYLLCEGEICIAKNAKLFVENPNKLYVNRRAYQRSQRAQALPYANLEKLYNYRPKQERIELGILEKDNIFGEQEAFLRTPRQTEARVCSPTVKYYVVEVADVEVLCKLCQVALKEKKYMPEDFRDFLFANITRKKILYRQDKFSEVLSLKNRNQLDYFFLEQNQEEVDSPVKYKLQKINNKIAEVAKNSQASPTNKSLSLRKNQSQPDPEDKPAYDAFNFTRMINLKDLKDGDAPETPEEKKLKELTHTTRFVQKQVDSEVVLNRLRNPVRRGMQVVKQRSNLSDPLFQPDYFTNLSKQVRRMEQEYRKMRFSFKMPEKKSRSLTNKNQRLQPS